jgi:hypothetical protein
MKHEIHRMRPVMSGNRCCGFLMRHIRGWDAHAADGWKIERLLRGRSRSGCQEAALYCQRVNVSHFKTRRCAFRSPAPTLAAALENTPAATAESFMLIAKWKVFFDSEQPQIGNKSPDRNLRVPGRGEVPWVCSMAHPFMGTLQASPRSVAGFWLRKDTLKIAEPVPATNVRVSASLMSGYRVR